MVYRALQHCCAIVVAVIPLSGLCQTQPDPLDPRAPVPVIRYHSAISESPALDAAAVGSWLNANDNVNRIGGWRTYAREAPMQAPLLAPPAQTQPAAATTEPSPRPKGSNQSGH
jgi:hypothetical protein